MYNYPWQQPMAPQQPVDDRIWVNGQAEAEAFLMAPNNIVHLWHRTEPIIFERRTDMTGGSYPLVIMRYNAERVKTKDEIYEERIKALEDQLLRMGQGGNNEQ